MQLGFRYFYSSLLSRLLAISEKNIANDKRLIVLKIKKPKPQYKLFMMASLNRTKTILIFHTLDFLKLFKTIHSSMIFLQNFNVSYFIVSEIFIYEQQTYPGGTEQNVLQQSQHTPPFEIPGNLAYRMEYFLLTA